MKEEECVMEEKSQSRDAVRQTKRASFFFLSPLSELVLANWPSLLDTHLVCSHTVESAQPGPGRAGISYLRRGQGRIIDQDPARGGVCVLLCLCETSMWALPFWRPQAISCSISGPLVGQAGFKGR